MGQRVTYYESPAYAVAEALRKKGYQIADCSGTIVDVDATPQDFFGIISPQISLKRRVLGLGSWEQPRRGIHKGNLFINNDTRGARPNENWILEVYGRENVSELTEVLGEISNPFGVSVHIILGDEQPRKETYTEDWH